MKTLILIVVVLLITVAPNAGCMSMGVGAATLETATNPMERGGPPAAPLRYELTGPYQTSNLAVFLIHSPPGVLPAPRPAMTLQEAIARHEVTVHETGSVNELAISNSSDSDVFVQSGDIVKGGQQDRAIAFDFIVPAGARRMPVASFCVEHGRWTGRAGESSGNFASSSDALVSKDLKLAAKYQANQGAVWNAVSRTQEWLGSTLGRPVADQSSPTSLQLTLEDTELRKWADEYVTGLAPTIDGKNDVIGYALLINGKLNSAEVYASPAVFRKIWPRLLRSNGIEAIAEMRRPRADPPAGKREVRTLIEVADKGSPASRRVNDRTRFAMYEADSAVMFETRDESAGGQWVHRSYFAR